LDDDGWFATGDSGRYNRSGDLVFIERSSESIRVKGEFVPLSYVEGALASVPGIEEVALWKRDDGAIGDELVAYVVADSLDSAAILLALATLPAFMRPQVVIRLDSLPRDGGVGKVRRRELAHADALDVLEL
jgi:acyl-CoA synthetase (AMP-forming)/AMP-acid ligase II